MCESSCPIEIEPKISIIPYQCRICYDNDKTENLITPCQCKGTMGFVHSSCLRRWLLESKTTFCELCNFTYGLQNLYSHSTHEKIWDALGRPRRLRADMITCTLGTPLAIGITYWLLYLYESYNDNKYAMLHAAKWTSVILFIFVGLLLTCFYLWVYIIVKMHSRMWSNWCQRESAVRYLNSTANLENLQSNSDVSLPEENNDADQAQEGSFDSISLGDSEEKLCKSGEKNDEASLVIMINNSQK